MVGITSFTGTICLLAMLRVRVPVLVEEKQSGAGSSNPPVSLCGELRAREFEAG